MVGKVRPPESPSAAATTTKATAETQSEPLGSPTATTANVDGAKVAAEPINIVPVFDPFVVTSNKEIQKDLVREDVGLTSSKKDFKEDPIKPVPNEPFTIPTPVRIKQVSNFFRTEKA